MPNPLRALPRRAAVLALAVAACGPTADPDDTDTAATNGLAVREIASPAGPGSGEPNLSAGPDGVHLSWLERSDSGRHALRMARWDGEAWSDTVTVIDRDDLFVNWADFPSVLALDDGTLAAHWLQRSGPGTYSYDVHMAVSTDGGRTWSPDVIPHRDGVETEHGFVSLFPVDGRIGAVWLDGRGMAEGDPMSLRFGTVGRDGAAGEEALLDASTCDCCQTSVAITERGPIVAYRDRTADEVRDIHVVRRVDGEWLESAPVHDDGWVIPGCPVNGPSIDAAGDRVAVAWFTAAGDSAGDGSRQGIRRMGENGRVLAAFSDDAGATFGPPVTVSEGVAMGRAGLVLTGSGDAVVSWVERVDGGAEIRVRRVRPDGAGPVTSVATTAAERSSGFPRMARHGRTLLMAWTQAGDPSRVRAAVLTLDDEPATDPERVAAGGAR